MTTFKLTCPLFTRVVIIIWLLFIYFLVQPHRQWWLRSFCRAAQNYTSDRHLLLSIWRKQPHICTWCNLFTKRIQYRSRTESHFQWFRFYAHRQVCARAIRSLDQWSQIINFIVAISATSGSETEFLLCIAPSTCMQFPADAIFSKRKKRQMQRIRNEEKQRKNKQTCIVVRDAKQNA